MPVITRSATGPTKKMVGVKRKFIEILDSDDETDTTTVYTESESEPDIEDDLKDTEESNNALIDLIIKERETNRSLREDSDQVIDALQKELDETTQKYEKLLNNVKEAQKTTLIEFIVCATMLAITAGASLAAYFACSEDHYDGFRF